LHATPGRNLFAAPICPNWNRTRERAASNVIAPLVFSTSLRAIDRAGWCGNFRHNSRQAFVTTSTIFFFLLRAESGVMDDGRERVGELAHGILSEIRESGVNDFMDQRVQSILAGELV